jgi:hypothetical protein
MDLAVPMLLIAPTFLPIDSLVTTYHPKGFVATVGSATSRCGNHVFEKTLKRLLSNWAKISELLNPKYGLLTVAKYAIKASVLATSETAGQSSIAHLLVLATPMRRCNK